MNGQQMTIYDILDTDNYIENTCLPLFIITDTQMSELYNPEEEE